MKLEDARKALSQSGNPEEGLRSLWNFCRSDRILSFQSEIPRLMAELEHFSQKSSSSHQLLAILCLRHLSRLMSWDPKEWPLPSDLADLIPEEDSMLNRQSFGVERWVSHQHSALSFLTKHTDMQDIAAWKPPTSERNSERCMFCGYRQASFLGEEMDGDAAGGSRYTHIFCPDCGLSSYLQMNWSADP